MRTATRGRVHKSVLKPWARAPRRSSQSRRSICRALNRGLRPARPAPRSPRTPPRFHCLYHRLTLWRLTPSRREISAMIHFPAANMQAAWLRRCSNAAKSRRTRNLVGMPTLYAQRECLSLYYARFSKSIRLLPPCRILWQESDERARGFVGSRRLPRPKHFNLKSRAVCRGPQPAEVSPIRLSRVCTGRPGATEKITA